LDFDQEIYVAVRFIKVVPAGGGAENLQSLHMEA
jgi:hypothetical protein